MIPHINEYDQNTPEFKQAWNNALILFPYEDGNVEDDIAHIKRRIYVHGFMQGVPFKEIYSLKTLKEFFKKE